MHEKARKRKFFVFGSVCLGPNELKMVDFEMTTVQFARPRGNESAREEEGKMRGYAASERKDNIPKSGNIFSDLVTSLERTSGE